MKWYAAHIIMYPEFKGPPLRSFPVYENIVLVHAHSANAAFEKAEEHGRIAEHHDFESYRCGGRPARMVFAGVRKMIECVSPDKRPNDGTEVTYNVFEMESYAAVKRLVAGQRVKLRASDGYRTDPD